MPDVETQQWVANHPMEIILVALLLLVILLIMQAITGSTMVRNIVCGILFFTPFGGMASMLTQACGAIPA